ncbi:FH2 domain-containing protein 1 [Desmophyllum pertusum]|uniref:FH2 domain-containing protein 1 n=1 Tax=Desmophyllum pertusum TaxID=174260 RepID=A0A9W9YQX2_9CNID|nr:FH2 domain-containing protein 1 [Desmophyllum pertusum]
MSVELHNLNDVEPELFLKFVRIPSLKTYTSLIRKLEGCSKKWLTEFLVLGGLTSLFEVLEKLSERGLAKFSDAFLQLECVRCIKAVLNNVTGLEFMTNDPSLKNLHLVTGR